MIQRIEALGLFGIGLFTKNPDNMTLGHSALSYIKAIGLRIRKLFPTTTKSNPISKMLRPMFELPGIKSLVGAQLAIMTVLAGTLSSVPMTALGVIPTDLTLLEERIEVEVKTDKALSYPAPATIGVSQRYHVFHPGIDIRAPKGSDVNPIAAGVVTLVVSETYGYGHRIEIDHGGGVTSLYAHLGKMYVEEGDEVKPETVIGEIGMTGMTTGPHLHLEVFEDGKTVNPVKYLDNAK